MRSAKGMVLILALVVLFALRVAAASPASGPVADILKEQHNVALQSGMRHPVGQAFRQENTGGPDAFGYTYIDSKSAGGPVFNWVDISGTGTQVFGADVDDEYAYPVPIGFTFSFYGQTFTDAAIGSNGTIYFGTDAYLGLGNECIPGTNDYDINNNIIALYWNDLYTASGEVLYQTLGTAPTRRFVVMFHQVSFCCDSPDSPMDFEAILSEADGSVLLQYLNPNTGNFASDDNGGTATVGIQKEPTLGLQYSCYAPALSAGLAIRFSTVGSSAYDLSYLDDLGRSQVCANSKTGDWQYTVLSGFGKGVYTGKSSISKTADRWTFRSVAGSPRLMLLTFYPQMFRATASLGGSDFVSQLSDRNTKDDPPGCSAK